MVWLMKIICWNIWAGRKFDELMTYLKEASVDTDVFCFQEVLSTTSKETMVDEFYRANIYQELVALLLDYNVYFAPIQEWCAFHGRVDFDLTWAQAMFVKKGISVSDEWSTFIFKHYNARQEDNITMPRVLQYISVDIDGQPTLLAHFHWLWTWGGKWDTESRLEQSRIINDFLAKRSERIVLMWDFNLLPDTKSFALLKEGRRDLIEEFSIETTRSKLYGKPLKLADYVLLDHNIDVKTFSVPYLEASDHLPLVFEIE